MIIKANNIVTNFKTKINKQILLVILLNISTIISLMLLLALTITISIIPVDSINHFFHVTTTTTGWQVYSSKIYLIILLGLLSFFSLLAVIMTCTVKIENMHKNIIIVSLLAIFSINPLLLVVNVIKHYQWQKTITFRLVIKQSWTNLKLVIGIKRWLISDYTLIGLFTALTISCAFIEQNLLPSMPYGGGIALKYMPLMVISYLLGLAAGWLTGMISALMSLLFIPGGYIISAWSFLLDYLLPMMTPAIVACLRFNLKANKSIFTYINYFLHCFLVSLIIYFWQTISGYFIWSQITNVDGSSSIWPGFNPLFYALVYNFIHIFLFTYPMMQLIIPVIYRSLVSYYIEKYR